MERAVADGEEDSMVASGAKLRVLRDHHGGGIWQIVCSDCGPLESVGDERRGVESGRAHLLRVHAGGGLAVDVGPYRDVTPTSAVGATARLEEIAARLERQGPLPANDEGSERLGRALLASHRGTGGSAVGGTVDPPTVEPDWTGWRQRSCG